MYTSMDEIRTANRQAGQHFFEAGAMKFFNSRIESTVIDLEYFITSEQFEAAPRTFTVRRADERGHIQTVGEIHQYRTQVAAELAVNKLADSDDDDGTGGQDRESYSDTQDRGSYEVDPDYNDRV